MQEPQVAKRCEVEQDNELIHRIYDKGHECDDDDHAADGASHRRNRAEQELRCEEDGECGQQRQQLQLILLWLCVRLEVNLHAQCCEHGRQIGSRGKRKNEDKNQHEKREIKSAYK